MGYAKSRKKGIAKRGRKLKPVTPLPVPDWDLGADGPANRAGLIVEERGAVDTVTGRTINPNGVKGARRVDMLDTWHRRGIITTSGYNAAVALRDAFEQTGRAPGWPDNDRVQSSPKPDHAVTIQIDRLDKFHKISKLIEDGDKPIIFATVLGSRLPTALGYRGPKYKDGLAHMRDALDRLYVVMQRFRN